MTKYAHIKDGGLYKFYDLQSPPPAHKADYILLVVDVPRPAFDSATQEISKDDGVVGVEWVNDWVVRDLTQAEIDAVAAQEAAELDSAVTQELNRREMKATFILSNQIRALMDPPKAPRTKSQFKTWYRNI